MAALIRAANNEPEFVRPAHGEAFTLAELQAFVGGYIEAVYLPDGQVLFCNEDGKRLELPPNRFATHLCHRGRAVSLVDTIVGDVIVCTRVEAGQRDDGP